MRIFVLKEGSVVCSDNNQSWLFGAPEGIKGALDNHGVEVPNVVFTTSLRAPGIGHLNKSVLRFKEQPLTMNGWSAKPLSRKHGTDYVIDSGGAKILFSERGDVSTDDTEGYHLAIIKNKHRSNGMGQNVITWPWVDSEYLVNEGVVTPIFKEEVFKVWSDMKDVPDNLKSLEGAPLSLEQANFIARVAKGAAEGGKENWGIAISSFRKSYTKKGDSWVERKTKTKEMEMEKISPENALYEPKGGEGIKCCATCEYFCNNLTCCKVEGPISPMGVCSLWEYEEPEEPEDEEESNPMMGNDMMSHMAYMEEVKDSEGRTAKDYLVVGDPKKVTTWHLAYQTNGKPDIDLMGASSAALTVGFRGSKYEGPNPEEAIKKLVAAYRAIEKEPPDNLKKAAGIEVKEKEEDFATQDVFIKVYKDQNGNDRWASISSVAMWDRQGEFFSTKAMDWAIAFAKLTGYKGPLRFKHVPGLDGGDCDTQFRIGDYLFESGTFRNNRVGRLMREKMKSNDGYQISLGLAFAKEDMKNGIYSRAAIFERSMTKKPAVPVTSIITKEEIEMKIMTEEELKQAAEELGMDVTEVKTMYERALASGNPLSQSGLKEALKTSGMGAATATEEDDEKYTKEQMKEILESLTVAEFKELEELIEETKAGDKKKMPPWLEETDNEDAEGEMPTAKKKEEDRITNLEKLVLQQTKAMEKLGEALTGQKNTNDMAAAMGQFLSQLPREQASRFVSSQTKSVSGGVNDEEMLTKFKAVVEDALKKQAAAGPSAVYDLFTSKNLNQKGQ